MTQEDHKIRANYSDSQHKLISVDQPGGNIDFKICYAADRIIVMLSNGLTLLMGKIYKIYRNETKERKNPVKLATYQTHCIFPMFQFWVSVHR